MTRSQRLGEAARALVAEFKRNTDLLVAKSRLEEALVQSRDKLSQANLAMQAEMLGADRVVVDGHLVWLRNNVVVVERVTMIAESAEPEPLEPHLEAAVTRAMDLTKPGTVETKI